MYEEAGANPSPLLLPLAFQNVDRSLEIGEGSQPGKEHAAADKSAPPNPKPVALDTQIIFQEVTCVLDALSLHLLSLPSKFAPCPSVQLDC